MARMTEELRSFDVESRSSSDLEKILREFSSGEKLDDKLSLAGYLTLSEQSKVKRMRLILVAVFSVMFGAAGFSIWNIPGMLGGVVFGLYVSLVIYSIVMSLKRASAIRKVYYELPLLLEELVLLVESGLALFPALEQICRPEVKLSKSVLSPGREVDSSVARRLLRTAYRLAAHGMPISEAFEQVSRISPFPVLRQVLLHLDISSSVGGELLHSLRTLSEQVHREWKLAVETRVKRLENFVVFPVFVSVLGLMILASAVPLVPILEFMSSMSKNGKELSNITKEGSRQAELNGTSPFAPALPAGNFRRSGG
ncbi:MAG TPA: type II secretion system F family protein [Oligoflexia bacterium]|nr:type II secretion system F family protein [Oligoflexia bacterium]